MSPVAAGAAETTTERGRTITSGLLPVCARRGASKAEPRLAEHGWGGAGRARLPLGSAHTSPLRRARASTARHGAEPCARVRRPAPFPPVATSAAWWWLRWRCLVASSEPPRLDGTTWQRGLVGNLRIHAGGSATPTPRCQPTRSAPDALVFRSRATLTERGVLEFYTVPASGRRDVLLLSEQSDDVAIQSCP